MTSAKQKLSLIFLGICTSLLLVEIFLRLTGFAFLLVQEFENKRNLKQSHLIRVLCIGESTTALGGDSSYPAQLEKILNAQSKDKKFKVINGGIPATESTFHANRLAKLLNQYKPQIVVTMLGINDIGTNNHTTAEPVITDSFLKKSRVYKLFSFIQASLRNRRSSDSQKDVESALKTIEAQIQKNPTAQDYFMLYGYYRTIQRFEEATAALEKSLALDPANCSRWGTLGTEYKNLMDFEKAAQSFVTMLGVCDAKRVKERALAYSHLASSFTTLKQYDLAIAVYQENLKHFPHDIAAWGEIGKIYLELGQLEKAEKFLQKQIARHPNNPNYYGKLAECYAKANNHATALKVFTEGMRLNPQTPVVYLDYAIYLIRNKKFAQTEDILNQALKLDLKNFDDYYRHALLSHLLAAYEGQNKTTQADHLRRELLMGYENSPKTRQNYEKIQRTLDKRKAQWVAVQYPMRDVAPLKAMFPESSNVLFVDNKKSFENAVRHSGYYTYFTDRFAGDFGHCTAEGNRLLADNIAQIILQAEWTSHLPV